MPDLGESRAVTDTTATHLSDHNELHRKTNRVEVVDSGSAIGVDEPTVILGYTDGNAVASDLGAGFIVGGEGPNFNNVIGGDGSSTVNDGDNPNVASTGTNADYSVIIGLDCVAGGQASYIRGFHNYTAIGSDHGTIGGGSVQTISAGSYGTIGGGSGHDVSGDYATIAGGIASSASANGATVGGGNGNAASQTSATVAGGESNTASGTQATVGGGEGNTASANDATVSGGKDNTASDTGAAVGGGDGNTASADYAAIAGGRSIAASGNYAAVGGGQNHAVSGAYATVAGGLNNDTTQNYSTIVGGRDNTVGAEGGTSIGNEANADVPYSVAQATGKIAAVGDAQSLWFTAAKQTTNGSSTQLRIDSFTKLTIPTDTTWAVRALIVARRVDSTGESAAYELLGCIDNNGGTTALVGSVSKTVIAEDTAAWDVAMTADDTNDALVISVTGEAAKTINWVANIQIASTVGAP